MMKFRIDRYIISVIEVRSDYETTLSIRSEMNILVPKSERIGSDSDWFWIRFAHLYLVVFNN